MGALVEGVLLDKPVPQPPAGEDGEVALAQLVAGAGAPLGVAVVGQELAGVALSGGAARLRVPGRERLGGGGLETGGVGVDRAVGEQRHRAAGEDDAVGQAERPAGVVGSLAQVRRTRRRGEVRPQGVDDLLPRKAVRRREREHLHKRRGPLLPPRVVGKRPPVHLDTEAAEHTDADGVRRVPHRCSVARRRTGRVRPRGARARRHGAVGFCVPQGEGGCDSPARVRRRHFINFLDGRPVRRRHHWRLRDRPHDAAGGVRPDPSC